MSARFLLDTDTCIYAINSREPSVVARFDRLRPGEAVISVIAFGELEFGASKSRSPETVQAYLAALLSVADLQALPVEAARHYAQIRRALESRGTPIGGNDLWLAAHARAAGLTLVSNNEREFGRVPGLKVQNWVE